MMWNLDQADWDKMGQMMQKSGCGNLAWGNYFQIHWIFSFITWILVMILLIGLIRWVWKKGGR